MAGRRCGVAHAPKTYLKLGMGAAPVARFREAGVPVGLASDGPVSNNTLDILESLRLMAMVAKHEAGDPTVMPVAEALTIATRESARVFGLPDDLGHSAAHLDRLGPATALRVQLDQIVQHGVAVRLQLEGPQRRCRAPRALARRAGVELDEQLARTVERLVGDPT